MSEGERRAGGVQAAAYEKPAASPEALHSLEGIFRAHHGAQDVRLAPISGDRERERKTRFLGHGTPPAVGWTAVVPLALDSSDSGALVFFHED